MEAAAETDLLLDAVYSLPAQVVRRFRRSALIDIDPGQLQIWMSEGQIRVAPHDTYFSIGETVGRPEARFPDYGLTWHYTAPPVFLPAWPVTPALPQAPYTTVSGWWGEWMEYRGEFFNNDKRTSFLEYLELPALTLARLELALTLGRGEGAEEQMLKRKGWQLKHSWDVAVTPDQYRRYIEHSKGEFSCAKPACMCLENAWISDRTLCYLASGKPAIVQYTGHSRFLPDAEGCFGFVPLRRPHVRSIPWRWIMRHTAHPHGHWPKNISMRRRC